MKYKSLHTIYYALTYDNNYQCQSHLHSCDFIEEIGYFPQFNSLFSEEKIATFELETLKRDKRNYVATKESKLKLLLTDKEYILDVNYVKVYCLKAYRTLIIALNVVNREYDNYIDLSLHLDKNTSYAQSDTFKGIMINNQYISRRHTSRVSSANLLNKFFFNKELQNPHFILGRKNYHMFSIIDDRLGELCKNIDNDTNYEIYKIATSEPVNATVGRKTYNEFLDTIYDKWEGTGSLYIVNSTNILQILPKNGVDHSKKFMKTYEKMVILSLFQKCLFVEFQTIDQKKNDIHKFKKFINQYYYLEVSPEKQMDTIYKYLQKELKNLEYYEILTGEIEIYSAAINNRIMFFVTATYTIFALMTLIIMLWEVLWRFLV